MNAGNHVGGETGQTTLVNNGDWKQMVLLYLLNDTDVEGVHYRFCGRGPVNCMCIGFQI